nr:MAG TPA: hypothetical protein [Caudoviricetes sp.]
MSPKISLKTDVLINLILHNEYIFTKGGRFICPSFCIEM